MCTKLSNSPCNHGLAAAAEAAADLVTKVRLPTRRFEASTSGADPVWTKRTTIAMHRHRGRLLLGAKSPCLSWTRSPASTAYCRNGVRQCLPHLVGGYPSRSDRGQ